MNKFRSGINVDGDPVRYSESSKKIGIVVVRTSNYRRCIQSKIGISYPIV